MCLEVATRAPLRACSQVKAIRESKKKKKKRTGKENSFSPLCWSFLQVSPFLCGLSAYVYFQSPWGVAFCICIFPRVLVVIIGARGSGGLTGSHVAPHVDVFLLALNAPSSVGPVPPVLQVSTAVSSPGPFPQALQAPLPASLPCCGL